MKIRTRRIGTTYDTSMEGLNNEKERYRVAR